MSDSTPSGPFTPMELFETHLEEATFLWDQRRAAATSPQVLFPWVADTVEARLLAHLDALVLGGPRVAQALLEPASAAEEEGRVFSAAYALLASGAEAAREQVLSWLESEEAVAREGATHALALAPGVDLEALLPPRLSRVAPPVASCLLRVLALRGRSKDVRLEPFLGHEAPAVVLAALQAARRLAVPVEPSALEVLLASSNAEVRDTALEVGMVRNLRGAWVACGERVKSTADAGWAAAARLWAMACDTDEKLEPLLAALKVPGLRPAAVRALGITGRVAAADALLGLMSDEALAPLAGEAFSGITGLMWAEPFVLTPPEPEEGAEDDTSPDAGLPVPNAGQVARWWAEARGGFERRGRYLWGRPFGWERLTYALAEGPTRGRAALSLELAIRTRGARQVTLEGWAFRQRRELAGLVGMNEEHATRSLESMLGEGIPRPARTSPALEPWVSPRYHPRRVSPESLAITGLGMVSTLGDGVVDGCAAARASLVRPCSLEDVTVWDEDACELLPVSGHAVDWLARGFRGTARRVVLGSAALADLLRQQPVTPGPAPRTALLLVLSSGAVLAEAERAELEQASGARPPADQPTRADGVRHAMETSLARRLLEATPVPGGVQHVELFFEDAPGLHGALQWARQALLSGKVDRCLVGGIDSWVEPESVGALEMLRMVKTPDRAVGLVPGEGAAFLQVETTLAARRRGAQVHAHIDAMAQAREPTSAVATGEALSRALSQVLAQRGGEQGEVGLVIGHLTGAAARARDWGSALVRLDVPAVRRAPDWHPALHFGETGAATGVLSLCMAARAFARGYAPSPAILVWLWAETGTRAALSIRAPDQP
ncbi:TIGR02270 family protein [Corallococcus terminator]